MLHFRYSLLLWPLLYHLWLFLCVHYHAAQALLFRSHICAVLSTVLLTLTAPEHSLVHFLYIQRTLALKSCSPFFLPCGLTIVDIYWSCISRESVWILWVDRSRKELSVVEIRAFDVLVSGTIYTPHTSISDFSYFLIASEALREEIIL